jgi:hypothetical protein
VLAKPPDAHWIKILLEEFARAVLGFRAHRDGALADFAQAELDRTFLAWTATLVQSLAARPPGQKRGAVIVRGPTSKIAPRDGLELRIGNSERLSRLRSRRRSGETISNGTKNGAQLYGGGKTRAGDRRSAAIVRLRSQRASSWGRAS